MSGGADVRGCGYGALESGCRFGGFGGFLGSFAEQGYARHYRHHADSHDDGERVIPYDDADERGQKGADAALDAVSHP